MAYKVKTLPASSVSQRFRKLICMVSVTVLQLSDTAHYSETKEYPLMDILMSSVTSRCVSHEYQQSRGCLSHLKECLRILSPCLLVNMSILIVLLLVKWNLASQHARSRGMAYLWESQSCNVLPKHSNVCGTLS